MLAKSKFIHFSCFSCICYSSPSLYFLCWVFCTLHYTYIQFYCYPCLSHPCDWTLNNLVTVIAIFIFPMPPHCWIQTYVVRVLYMMWIIWTLLLVYFVMHKIMCECMTSMQHFHIVRFFSILGPPAKFSFFKTFFILVAPLINFFPIFVFISNFHLIFVYFSQAVSPIRMLDKLMTFHNNWKPANVLQHGIQIGFL